MPVSNNMNRPAPLWFRRLETALVFLFMGLIPIIGLTKSIPVDLRDDLSLVVLPGLVLLTKSIGIFLGEAPPGDENKS